LLGPSSGGKSGTGSHYGSSVPLSKVVDACLSPDFPKATRIVYPNRGCADTILDKLRREEAMCTIPGGLQDDGLLTPHVGPWAIKKYKLIQTYAEMFATATKNKWECRVYVDLFSGAGRAQAGKIIEGSPLLSLGIPDPFDKYIFCELDDAIFEALSKRVAAHPLAERTHLLHGDVNKKVNDILAEIPAHSPDHKVLTFCVVDPFNMRDLSFETLRSLSARFVDFLVLIPSGMDANRNESTYTKPDNNVVERFLGDARWRSAWEEVKQKNRKCNFGKFVVDHFGQQMVQLGYQICGVQEAEPVRGAEKNQLLYHLSLYSRSKLGVKLWQQARKYSQSQKRFDFT
jgi:three-Cys-motif partner protein